MENLKIRLVQDIDFRHKDCREIGIGDLSTEKTYDLALEFKGGWSIFCRRKIPEMFDIIRMYDDSVIYAAECR